MNLEELLNGCTVLELAAMLRDASAINDIETKENVLLEFRRRARIQSKEQEINSLLDRVMSEDIYTSHKAAQEIFNRLIKEPSDAQRSD